MASASNMGKLMLLNGFENKNNANAAASTSALIEFLVNHTHTDGEQIQIWYDPYQEIRIVAMFQRDLETKKIQQLQCDGLHKEIVVEMVTPTNGIFVRTFGETFMHGAFDKLKLILAKKKENIKKIESLPNCCFEIIFNDGWDSVLNVCQEPWTVDRHKIMICPYFDCFKESPQEQYHRILYRLEMSLCTEMNVQRIVEHNNFFSFTLQVVPLLLDSLKFKESIELSEKDLKVHIDVEKAEITIQGSEDSYSNIKKLLSDVNNKLKLPDNTKDFLELEAIQQEILKFIKSSQLQIRMEKKEETFSLNVFGGHKTESFQSFVSSLVIVKKCHPLPDESFQSTFEWNDFISSITSAHLFYQVVTEGTIVKLLALSFSNDSETKSIEDEINEFISKLSDIKATLAIKVASMNEEKRHVTQLCQTPKSSVNSFSLLLNFNEMQYCNQFLLDDVSNIQEQNAETQINLRSNDIQIICNNYQVLAEVSRQLKSLFKNIISLGKDLEFPGINLFFQSEDGKKLIFEISQKYKCCIEDPFSKGEIYNSQLQKIERFNYKFCVQRTGRRNNCNIHLVQGNIEDMKLHQSFDTKVQFIPSIKDQVCSLKTMEFGRDIRILLPPWKSSDMDSQTHFRKLRQTFLASIDGLFQQIKNAESCTVVISTSSLHQAEFPFPLDVIANSVTQIFKTFADLNDNPKTVDIYVCETKHEFVFKAFTHELKNQGIIVGAPDQASWEKISFPNIFNCAQYSTLNFKVEVASITPESPTMKSLYCYPIQPSLEASSCPFYYETKRSKHLLEDSLRKLQSNFPDGLLIGETCIIDSSSYNKCCLLFCFPEWGTNIHKALQDSLTKCILVSSEYDAVYITVPESQHPKFPKQYFVQTFFRTTDEILSKLSIFRQKKIVFVVHDDEFREAFHKELQRRYKTDTKKVVKSHNLSSISQEASMTDPNMLTNTVLVSPITYWGKSKDDLIQAHNCLTKELSGLMSKFTTTQRLTEEETLLFEKNISAMQEIPVLFILQKIIQEQRKKTEKEMYSNKTSFYLNETINPYQNSLESLLIIEGLSKKIVHDFTLNFTCRHDKKDLFRTDSGQQHSEDHKINDESHNSDSKSFVSKKRSHVKDSTSHLSPASFNWKLQNVSKSGTVIFTNFPLGIEQLTETAYNNNQKKIDIKSGIVETVNFPDMTVIMRDNKEIKGIIRTEVLEFPEKDSQCETRSLEDKHWRLVELYKPQEEFQKIFKELTEHIPLKIEIEKIQRVENVFLDQRFNVKGAMLKARQPVFMWHKVSFDNAPLVCQFGFHPRFSSMHAEALGDGVLFKKNPFHCFETREITSRTTKYIFKASLILGKTGPSRKWLQCKLEDMAVHPQDSVLEDDQVMIFSDAQAYPCYLIGFKFCGKK